MLCGNRAEASPAHSFAVLRQRLECIMESTQENSQPNLLPVHQISRPRWLKKGHHVMLFIATFPARSLAVESLKRSTQPTKGLINPHTNYFVQNRRKNMADLKAYFGQSCLRIIQAVTSPTAKLGATVKTCNYCVWRIRQKNVWWL